MPPKVSTHPALTHAQDVKTICQPLEKLNINYFAHGYIDKSNHLTAISSNPIYFENYLKNKHYNIDIHTARPMTLGDQIMWDAIELTGKCASETEEAKQFGVDHVFTLIEHEKNGTHYYHFASNKMGTAINQVYLNHIDLLKLFVCHFKEKTSTHKVLRQAYDLKFSIDEETEGFLIKGNASQLSSSGFLKDIKLSSATLPASKSLSIREMEILMWLHHGKTVNDIARILNLADITINKHIANIKEKSGCYTQFQLGEFFKCYLTI